MATDRPHSGKSRFVDSRCGFQSTPEKPRLSPGVGPTIGCIQHRQHGAALGALTNLRRPRQQLRLAPAQPVHRDEHKLAVERIDDLGPLERHRVVAEQLVQTQRGCPGRRLHAVARGVGPLLLGRGVLPLERQLPPHPHPLRAPRGPRLAPLNTPPAPPATPATPGSGSGSRSGDPSGVSTGLGSTRHCSPNATWLRPAALARYSARSAATRTSSTAGPRPGANSATPMLTVTSPAG